MAAVQCAVVDVPGGVLAGMGRRLAGGTLAGVGGGGRVPAAPGAAALPEAAARLALLSARRVPVPRRRR